MSLGDFDRCMAVTLLEEDRTGTGRITYDAGGITRWGIAQRYHPEVDVENLSLADAKGIYRRKYWDVLRCSELIAPLAMVVFDGAVNPGPAWAGRTLQWILKARVDGVVGPETLRLAKNAGPETCVEFSSLREARFMESPHAATNINGWRRRCFRVLYQAARMED